MADDGSGGSTGECSAASTTFGPAAGRRASSVEQLEAARPAAPPQGGLAAGRTRPARGSDNVRTSVDQPPVRRRSVRRRGTRLEVEDLRATGGWRLGPRPWPAAGRLVTPFMRTKPPGRLRPRGGVRRRGRLLGRGVHRVPEAGTPPRRGLHQPEHPRGPSLHYSVRRDKVPFLSGCESRPATVAPAGSSRSGRWR